MRREHRTYPVYKGPMVPHSPFPYHLVGPTVWYTTVWYYGLRTVSRGGTYTSLCVTAWYCYTSWSVAGVLHESVARVLRCVADCATWGVAGGARPPDQEVELQGQVGRPGLPGPVRAGEALRHDT